MASPHHGGKQRTTKRRRPWTRARTTLMWIHICMRIYICISTRWHRLRFFLIGECKARPVRGMVENEGRQKGEDEGGADPNISIYAWVFTSVYQLVDTVYVSFGRVPQSTASRRHGVHLKTTKKRGPRRGRARRTQMYQYMHAYFHISIWTLPPLFRFIGERKARSGFVMVENERRQKGGKHWARRTQMYQYMHAYWHIELSFDTVCVSFLRGA